MTKETNKIPASDHDTRPTEVTNFKPLRIWPPILLLAGMVAARLVPTLANDESTPLLLIMMLGPVGLGLLILVWWVVFSRATKMERVVGIIGAILVAVGSVALSDKTMFGPGIIVLTIPIGTAAFGIGAILFSRLLSFKRTWATLLLAALGFGFTALLQSHGMWGHGDIDWQWRWEKSPEQTMLANRDSQRNKVADVPVSPETEKGLVNPEWARFRGPDGLNQQRGPIISTDWSGDPPKELWRVPVGPGWASFAVAGNLLFTQEQLGDDEAVVCYDANTGKEVWSTTIKSRFFDPLGGPGPRATPTLANGMLFAQGANGELQRLDPRTGDVVWKKNLQGVADRIPPTWGFASSPLVVGSVVIVHAGGEDSKGILAFDVESGDLTWSAAAGDHSYSSPQPGNVLGQPSVLMLTNKGLHILDPASGEMRLDYEWNYEGGYRVIQPPVIDGDSVIIASQDLGIRRIRVSADSDGKLTAEEIWTTKNLKPDFNDFVVREDHAYGFDGAIFTCIDLKTGKKKWRKGRYGKGQVLLLADAKTLLVLSERGKVVLLACDPTEHRELAKFSALEGRTWNHPVLIGDRLYVRNSQEAACFQLKLADE